MNGLNSSVRTYSECPLQFACWCWEAVEHQILPDTVDPLPPGGQAAACEVPALTLTRAETPYYLYSYETGK